MAKESYIKLYRKLLNNPVVCKDSDHLAVWIWLLLNAVAFPKRVQFGGKTIFLQPGQLTTGRKVIADELGVNEYKVQRILKCFESEQQIAQQTDRHCRLISILSWDDYQGSEQQTAQPMHNSLHETCTTTCNESAQQLAQQYNAGSGSYSTDTEFVKTIHAQQDAQLMHNYCTTDAQLLHTKKERRERREGRERESYSSLIEDEDFLSDLKSWRREHGLPEESEVDMML